MTFKQSILLLPLVVLISLSSCDNGLTDIPVEPEIELISVSPTQVKAFQDSIVFVVEYTDGDGDLGTNIDTERNVFILDQRLNVTHEFRLKQLAPDGADVPITGRFDVTLPSTIKADSTTASESIVFELYVVDRAGNQSNTVVSEPVTVE